MEHSDFAVAVYLNQAVVFDLLAMIEDGITQMSTIRTSESKKAGTEAGIGGSNVFALLGVRLKGGFESTDGREVTQERVHTPLSLFAKVRTHLQKAKLVHDLTKESTHVADVRAGHFVEVEVRLRRNPLVESLEAVTETIGGIRVLTSWNKNSQKSPAEKLQETNLNQIAEHCKRLIGGLSGTGSVDLLGDLVPGPGQAVVSVEDRYFGEHSADEIAEGQFRVFGKVVRTVLDDRESINLLRNTKFAHMPNVFDSLKPGIAATKDQGLKLPDFVTEVGPPSIQIRPIAIFL
jgi:hypothetical protein